MTFDEFINAHRIDKHRLFGPESNVYAYVKLAWAAADKAAREECAELCRKVNERFLGSDLGGVAEALEAQIRETIK